MVPCCSPVTKQDIEDHFSSHGSGKIMEIKLMSGFGFIEYEDQMDARDVVPGELPCLLMYFSGRIIHGEKKLT